MKKVIRLTESDLTRIIKNVLSEQDGAQQTRQYYSDDNLLQVNKENIEFKGEKLILFNRSADSAIRLLNQYFSQGHTEFIRVSESEFLDFKKLRKFCKNNTIFFLRMDSTPNNFEEVCGPHTKLVEVVPDVWVDPDMNPNHGVEAIRKFFDKEVSK